MKNILLSFILLLLTCHVHGQITRPDAIICPGDSLPLIAKSFNADYYIWYKDGKMMRKSTDGIIKVAQSGEYRAVAFNDAGCISDTSAKFRIVYRNLWTLEDTASVFYGDKVDIPILHNDNRGCWDFNLPTIRIASYPSKGEVYINHDGSIQYIPHRYEYGEDQFKYTVDDMKGNRSEITPVTVTIGNPCGIIFPNPTTGQLTVAIENATVRYLRLTDMTGKIIFIEPARDDKQQVDMGPYADGMYILQLLDEHGKQVCMFKVLKKGQP